jgi:hypothetical protein
VNGASTSALVAPSTVPVPVVAVIAISLSVTDGSAQRADREMTIYPFARRAEMFAAATFAGPQV